MKARHSEMKNAIPLNFGSAISRCIKWIGVTGIVLLLSACANFETLAQPEIRSDAQLSISPSGKQVFLFRRDPGKYAKMNGRLFNVENGKSRWVREVTLPEIVWSTNWGYEEDQILVSGEDGEDKVLWKVNVLTDKRIEIYRSTGHLRFLHEFTPGRYIFLEANPHESGRKYSTWHALENGVKKELNGKPFRLASYLSNVHGNLFLYSPNNLIMPIEGEMPDLPAGVLDRTPWSLDCQSEHTTMCWQTYLDKFNGSYYPGTMEMIGDEGRCVVPGTWISENGTKLSRNGKTVVFHAINDFSSKERGVYLVRYVYGTCLVNEILIIGGNHE